MTVFIYIYIYIYIHICARDYVCAIRSASQRTFENDVARQNVGLIWEYFSYFSISQLLLLRVQFRCCIFYFVLDHI